MRHFRLFLSHHAAQQGGARTLLAMKIRAQLIKDVHTRALLVLACLGKSVGGGDWFLVSPLILRLLAWISSDLLGCCSGHVGRQDSS